MVSPSTPTPHARLLPPPWAVSDWSSSSATDDSCSGGEDEDFTNTTDPLALHSLEVLGESEEEAVAAYNAVNNGKCSTADRKKRKAAKQAVGIGKGESIDVPVHVGWADEVPCCLEFLLSEQPDFKEQQNAIQELVLSRGHFCIFLPKFHPELNFIERYWSRVKW